MNEQDLRVLLVDDEESLREPLAKYLRGEPYKYAVDAVPNGIEALRLLEKTQGRCDAALIDEVLEEGPGGLELLKQIKARYPDIEVILFTGWGLQSALEALRAGAYRYFAKPFDPEELALTIRFAAEHQELKSVAREKQVLERLMETSIALLGGQSEQEVLNSILRGVRAIGFDRVRLYLLSDDGLFMIGKAHVGMQENFIGSKRPVTDDFYMQVLIKDPRPHVFKQQEGTPVPFEESLERDGVGEWACVPLLLQGKVIGKLSVDNKLSRRPIVEEELGPVALFASQAAAAIENARLFKRVGEERDRVELLYKVSRQLSISDSDLPMLLQEIISLATNSIGATEGTLFVLGEEGHLRYWRSIGLPSLAERTAQAILEKGFAGRVLENGESAILPDFPSDSRWLTSPDDLVKQGSAIGVPLKYGSTALGVITLTNSKVSFFTDEHRLLLESIANQAAIAIQHATLFQKTKQWVEQLEALRRTTLAITSPLDRDTLLRTIVKQAVDLLEAKSGGIYAYYPERGELILIADHQRPKYLGRILKIGEGVAGRLVQSGESFVIVDDYNEWPGRASIYADDRPFEAVLEVPLKWQERIIGVLYIDDEVGRKFAPEDARLLGLFADQAAIALANTDLMAENEEKLRRLERLYKATKEITGNLGSMTLDELLTLIAKHATEILDAEVCGVYLVKREGFLISEASYGHQEDRFHEGKEFAIYSGPGAGLTGHLAYEGKLFNAHGDALINHPAVRAGGADDAPPTRCNSLLAVPLKKKVDLEEKLVGLLRVEDKKGKDGGARPTVGFTKEDEWILNIFAEAVVVAIESAELVGQLNEKKDHLARLIASSPEGIIAIDRQGNVTGFNERAQEIMGYTANEVLGKPVDPLYFDPQTPHEIGRLLRAAPDGKLSKYETFVRAKTRKGEEQGERIPIRLSATWLYDSEGKHIGSVGYFEDRRTIKETERRLELLLKTSHALAQAENLTDGLQRLAEMMVSLLIHTFCRILLLDESREFLVVKAAFPIPRSGGRLNWEPGLEQRTAVSKWRGLRELLEAGTPIVLKWSEKQVRPVLVRFSRWLGLERDIHSLLMVPLKMGNRVIGLLEVGEARGKERVLFTDAEIELASAIAAETTTLIDRMRLNEITERRKAELEHLHKAAKAMSGAFDLKHVLQTITEQAKDMLQADSSAIWPYDHVRDRFIPEELVAASIPDQELQRFKEEEPKPGKTACTVMEKGWIGVTDISSPEFEFLGQPTRELLERIEVKSFQGIVLKVADEPVGVLYVNYKQSRDFEDEDHRTLENLATYAALALKKARLLDQVNKAKKAAEVVAQVTALGDLDVTLSAVTKGTQEAVGCDAVVLFVYDQAADKLAHPPKMVGVHYQNLAMSSGEVIANSIVYKMLHRDEPYVVEEIAEDALFKDRRFARDEAIESCVAIPLKAAGQKVGVMFVNYRSRHRFTADELTNIELFANQAAVAISNAQLFGQVQRKVATLQTLYEAGRAITASLNLDDVLYRIAEEAWKLGGQVGYASIRLADDMRAKVVAAFPREELSRIRASLGEEIDLRTDKPIGITGRVIITGKSQRVGNVKSDPDYRESQPATQSELASPIVRGEQVIGVINVEHPNLNAFDEDHEHTLESLAAQAALAIHNARLHDETRRRAEALKGLYEAGKAITGSLALVETLNQIAKQALQIVGASCEKEGCFSHIAVPEGSKLKFITASPTDMLDALNRVEIDLAASPKKGIAGRAIITGQSQNVPDVKTDPDYIPTKENINSQLSVLLKMGEQIIGVLSIEHPKSAVFGEEDVHNIELLAAQATVAIENAQLFEEQVKELSEQEAIVELSQKLLGTVTLQEVLDGAVAVAADVLGADFCDIVLPDKDGTLIVSAGVGWNRDFVGNLRLDSGTGSQSGHTIMTKSPAVVDDYAVETRFTVPPIISEHGIKSGMSVPIFRAGEVIGAMLVHTKTPRHFNKAKVNLLSLIANQTAIAIRSAEHQARLLDVQEQLAAQTALEWMLIAGSTWGHGVTTAAIVIKENAQSVRSLIAGSDLAEKLGEKLRRVEEQAQEILNTRIPVPLSAEVGVELVRVNTFLHERVLRICEQRGKDVRIEWSLKLQDTAGIKVSPEWFRRALDILVDNAIESLVECPTKLLTISGEVKGKIIEIAVSDSGKGIPEEKRSKLFREPIPSGKGMGLGLMLASKIVRTYGGHIRLDSSGPTGTTVIISLPVGY